MVERNSFEQLYTRTALIAESDDKARNRIAFHLRTVGIDVLEAKTCVEALLLALDFPGRIELLFTALELRKYCNGPELAECLKASRPEMRIVYLAEEGTRNEEAGREIVMGEAFLLDKPVNIEDLDAILAESGEMMGLVHGH
ncbi:MAG: hypothetical protein ABI036_08270 [Fibrobacteria bacterium]